MKKLKEEKSNLASDLDELRAKVQRMSTLNKQASKRRHDCDVCLSVGTNCRSQCVATVNFMSKECIKSSCKKLARK